MTQLAEHLVVEIDAFEKIPISEETFEERKRVVRALDARIHDGSLSVAREELERLRHDDRALARIIAYLFLKHGNWKADVEPGHRAYATNGSAYRQRTSVGGQHLCHSTTRSRHTGRCRCPTPDCHPMRPSSGSCRMFYRSVR
jgi:hypothetical protein